MAWCALLWGASCALPAQSAAFELSLRDGKVLLASSIEGDPTTGFEVATAGKRQKLAAGDLIAVHGCAVQSIDLAAAFLCGDEVVCGALVGGDDAGDHLEMLSPSLGKVVLPVERLRALASPGSRRLSALSLPQGVGEALFRRASVGYDVIAGSLHQFGERGVRFQPDGEAAPRWFRLQDITGLRIADGEPRKTSPGAFLRTRTGDVLGVEVRRFTASAVECELEGGARIEVRYGDLASLDFVGIATFLSDLLPSEGVESGFDGPTVYPWRRDLSVLGTPLVAMERTHGKGLGMHSRSRLTFTVPAGCGAFWTRVAIDDSAAGLSLRPDADVRVLVNDKVRFEHKGLGVGRPPEDSGLIPVQVGDHLSLEVDFGKGRDLGDRVDWLTPVLLPTPGRQ